MIVLFFMLLAFPIFAQNVYDVPFASKSNEIELEILNESEGELSDLVVRASQFPSWIKFDSETKSKIEDSWKESNIYPIDANLSKEGVVIAGQN